MKQWGDWSRPSVTRKQAGMQEALRLLQACSSSTSDGTGHWQVHCVAPVDTMDIQGLPALPGAQSWFKQSQRLNFRVEVGGTALRPWRSGVTGVWWWGFRHILRELFPSPSSQKTFCSWFCLLWETCAHGAYETWGPGLGMTVHVFLFAEWLSLAARKVIARNPGCGFHLPRPSPPSWSLEAFGFLGFGWAHYSLLVKPLPKKAALELILVLGSLD